MKQLKKARLDKGLTQEMLAQKVGISRQYYCDIENGRRSPGHRLIKKISQELGTSPLIFFSDDVASWRLNDA